MAVGYQSFYTAQLTSNITDTDLVIPLDVAPTPDEGFLVIESTVTAKREIIYYTSKTSNSVTCPSGAGNGRGYDGTTAVSHLSGSAVIMAPVGAMFSELREQFTTTPQGWTNLGIAQSGTITHNGNRSYTVPFASSVASTLSEGMKLQFTKTVAGNGYMGGLFNGSSHYFTKTTPSGTLGTVTNNFTIEAVVQPTSYALSWIAGRADSTPNNALGLKMNADGTVTCAVFNGGSANFRQLTTYQSLPLNKKTHVAASWTGGTVVIYFDGISVPVNSTPSTGGTAPTTAGTGGDFSIGRLGAFTSQYFPGYISNVAVFDAVLSAATIRQHATYKLTGSETNCIGAWSLDNTANDQNAAANNLTATGGVGFTAQTPHGQLGNGVETTKAVGLVMAVSGTDVTVQVPEGCTTPTTGGITSVAYSTQANPYGWVANKDRWEISVLLKSSQLQAAVTVAVTYNPSGMYIEVPANGVFLASYGGIVQLLGSTIANKDVRLQLSTSSSSFSVGPEEQTSTYVLQYTDTIREGVNTINPTPLSNSTATKYYLLFIGGGAGTLTNLGVNGTTPFKITLLPAGL